MSLLDVTTEIQAALTSLRRGQAFITEEIARLEAFLASGTTSSTQGPTKRRGRPPKAATTSAVVVPTKRGPGRPRKNAATPTAAGAPVKRGPGRPRKQAAAGGTTASKTGKRSWSPAQREQARKRMQEYWAKRKKG